MEGGKFGALHGPLGISAEVSERIAFPLIFGSDPLSDSVLLGPDPVLRGTKGLRSRGKPTGKGRSA